MGLCSIRRNNAHVYNVKPCESPALGWLYSGWRLVREPHPRVAMFWLASCASHLQLPGWLSSHARIYHAHFNYRSPWIFSQAPCFELVLLSVAVVQTDNHWLSHLLRHRASELQS